MRGSGGFMRAVRLLTCLWPGLSALWWQGALTGGIAAMAFGLAINTALIVTFLTPELLSPLAILGVWLVVTVCWLVAWWRSSRKALRNRAGEPEVNTSSNNDGEEVVDPFAAIQLEYLRGNHPEAAVLLNKHLRERPADADAHLLLATLLRHSEKYDDAKAQLTQLESLDGAGKWAMEIYQERNLIAELLEIEEEEREEAARVAEAALAAAQDTDTAAQNTADNQEAAATETGGGSYKVVRPTSEGGQDAASTADSRPLKQPSAEVSPPHQAGDEPPPTVKAA